jgi:MYXO-CTERM domain-containing protein
VFTATSALLGFALSPDGSEVRVGTETDGIHGARTSDLIFTQVNALGVRCLTWAGDRLYACAKEAVSGFTIGRSTDKGVTFEAIHHLSCLSGPDPACAVGTSVTDACQAKWAAQKQILQTNLCEGATSSSSSGGGATPPDGDADDGCGCAIPESGDDTPVSFVVAVLALGLLVVGLRVLPRRAPTSAQSDR